MDENTHMKGLLLINLGTPAKDSASDIKKFLKEFLMDHRVIDLPFIFRWILVNQIIIPKKIQVSLKAYKSIWTSKGSPFSVHSSNFIKKLSHEISDNFHVEYSVRYGNPSLEEALQKLMEKKVDSIYALPLYPQSAMATTESAKDKLKKSLKLLSKDGVPIYFLENFYNRPAYIESFSKIAKPIMNQKHYDHLLISFHGIPVRQIKKNKNYKKPCATKASCCADLNKNNKSCYRAQCFETARLLSRSLGFEDYSTVFQSRLGSAAWTKPYIRDELKILAQKGIHNIAVLCPSFVVDCVETLEEIQIQLKEEFISLGGQNLDLIPSLNDSGHWVKSFHKILDNSQWKLFT